MAQEAFEQLKNEWVALSDKITVDEDANYYIQNRGADILLAQEAGEAPTADNLNGTLIKPYEQAKYKANGGDLYLRAYNSNCSVNITSDKAQTGSAIWFDFNSEGFVGVDDAEAETSTFTKEIDGYDVELVWSYNSESTGFTATVTKDGESAGTASIWFVSENGDIKLNVSDLTLELTSETSFDYMSGEAWGDDYYGSFSSLVDAELGTALWMNEQAYYGEDESETLYLKIKLEA